MLHLLSLARMLVIGGAWWFQKCQKYTSPHVQPWTMLLMGYAETTAPSNRAKRNLARGLALNTEITIRFRFDVYIAKELRQVINDCH